MIVLTAILIPYVLTPWLMTHIFRKNAIEPLWLSYLFTFIVLMCCPYLVEWMLSAMRSASDNLRGMCAFPLVFINIFLIPLSLILQFVFNRITRTPAHKIRTS